MIAAVLTAIAVGVSLQEADRAGDALIACAPATLEAAISCLDSHWLSRGEFEALPYDEVSGAHFGMGMWMRNNWKLWGGGPLAQHFNTLGIHHPDDMSGIILESYWLHLHGCPLGVQEQVAWYQAFWALPPDSDVNAHLDAQPNLDCTADAGANA